MTTSTMDYAMQQVQEVKQLLRHNVELSPRAKARIRYWQENKRQPVERASWDQTFLLEAWRASQRSLDAQTKCGCVLVRDNTVFSSGYNSFIRDVDDRILPNLRDDKYDWMLHSEANAIFNAARQGHSTLGAVAYVTGEPCINCFQALYQCGIKKIVYTKNLTHGFDANEEVETKREILYWLTKNKIERVYIPQTECHWLTKTIEQIESKM